MAKKVIVLTTPISVGDLDPNGPYLHVNITRIQHVSDMNTISITCEAGNMVSDVWTAGHDNLCIPAGHTKGISIIDQPDLDPPHSHYTDVVTSIPGGVLDLRAELLQKLYEVVLTEGHYAGTIQDV